jgi:hypothetical protein
MRFSIRDLLWATLVVAMGLGWWVDRQNVLAELDRAKAWRMRAGALEEVLKDDGWEVTWDLESSYVKVDFPGTTKRDYERSYKTIRTDAFEPSAD